MDLSPEPLSFSLILKITIICLLVSNAELQLVDEGVLITKTSEYQCVVRLTADYDGDSNRGLKVVDREKGIVMGTFLLNPKLEHYNILLHWTNDTSKERCNKKRRDFFTYMVQPLSTSKCRNITDKNCNESNCKKAVEVYFRYIITGCYNFEVGMGTNMTHDTAKVMETDFLTSRIKNPNCGGSYQRKTFAVSLNADMENLVYDDTARIKVCFSESRNDRLCSTQNMFYISINESKMHKNEQQSNNEYAVEPDHLHVKLVNISQKVSNIILYLKNDIRCHNSQTVFYNVFCRLVIELAEDCKEVDTSPNTQKLNMEINLFGVLLPLLILPMILFSSVVIAKRICSKQSQNVYKDSVLNMMEGNNKCVHSSGDIMTSECTGGNSNDDMMKNRDFVGNKNVNKIILAYSQDCHEFMEVMKAFRSFLRDVMRFEVFDCFDPDLFQFTAQDKYGWVDRLIRHQDTGIILVETPLAVMIDEMITKRRVRVKYTNPTMFSNVFTYIIKQIRNPNINSYDKIAVIRFEEYSDEQFNMLDNKCIRFSIPNGLQALFHHFSRMCKTPAYSDTCMEMIYLKTCLEKLGEFREKNTNHLQRIIHS